MKLIFKVVCLEIAKKLKELNLKQQSEFYWVKTNSMTDNEEATLDWREWLECTGMQKVIICSAFSTAELGEMLPHNCSSYNHHLDSGKVRWTVKYEKDGQKIYKHAQTEADARGGMMIYLLENKLI